MPRQALGDCIRQDITLMGDSRRLEAILRDKCPESRARVKAIAAAHRMGIAGQLASNANCRRDALAAQMAIADLASQLRAYTGLNEGEAYWAVEPGAAGPRLYPRHAHRCPPQPISPSPPPPPPLSSPAAKPAPMGNAPVAPPWQSPQPANPPQSVHLPQTPSPSQPSGSPADIEQRFAKTKYAAIGEEKFEGIRISSNLGALLGGLAQPERAQVRHSINLDHQYMDMDCGGGVMMRLVLIHAGSFLMGSPQSEEGRYAEEGPQTHVSLTRDFWIGETAVTQSQWAAVMMTEKRTWFGLRGGVKAGGGSGTSAANADIADHPAAGISWNDAMEFCRRLTNRLAEAPPLALSGIWNADRAAFSLPAEAQWEYACRAGTESPFYFGGTISTEQANYNGTAAYSYGRKGEFRRATTPVKSFPPNEFGLYDMHGNVWEWCMDWFADKLPGGEVADPAGTAYGAARVLRGGSWDAYPWLCRSAFRYRLPPSSAQPSLGFRVVCIAQGLHDAILG